MDTPSYSPTMETQMTNPSQGDAVHRVQSWPLLHRGVELWQMMVLGFLEAAGLALLRLKSIC